MTVEEHKVFNQVVEALQDAESHLSYCGYGDSWESECAYKENLPDKIEKALSAASKLSD